jgi:hypothetical protein
MRRYSRQGLPTLAALRPSCQRAAWEGEHNFIYHYTRFSFICQEYASFFEKKLKFSKAKLKDF